MSELLDELVLYLRLAQAFKDRLQLSDRDRALVIAGSCAEQNQMLTISEFCRQLILQNNHGHMIRKWPSIGHAMNDDDFLHFFRQVRRRLPLERAESILAELNYQCDVQAGDYDTDEAYVAAVMRVDLEWLREHFGDKGTDFDRFIQGN